MSRNSVTAAAGVKLAIFTAASLFITGTLAVIMSNAGFGDSAEYRAVFTSASMLQEGDDVRVAGVSVGQVAAVEHHERSKAMVVFDVASGVPLTEASRAEVRFENLIGDRYLALEQGTDPDAPTLEPGGTIPIGNTSPSLDLTTLFNGFQPLFRALDPEQVNELSRNLIQVLQGEGGTIRSLLDNTASLTNTLADRDQLIGQVITNLTTTLETVDSRHEQLSDLVVELKDWLGDLARDRKKIGGSLAGIADLTVEVADLLKRGRPLLKDDIAQLRKLAKLLSKPDNEAVLAELLQRLPEAMTDQTRTGTYGSWYNYYLCGASASIQLPLLGDLPVLQDLQKLLNNISFESTAERCQ